MSPACLCTDFCSICYSSNDAFNQKRGKPSDFRRYLTGLLQWWFFRHVLGRKLMWDEIYVESFQWSGISWKSRERLVRNVLTYRLAFELYSHTRDMTFQLHPRPRECIGHCRCFVTRVLLRFIFRVLLRMFPYACSGLIKCLIHRKMLLINHDKLREWCAYSLFFRTMSVLRYHIKGNFDILKS